MMMNKLDITLVPWRLLGHIVVRLGDRMPLEVWDDDGVYYTQTQVTGRDRLRL